MKKRISSLLATAFLLIPFTSVAASDSTPSVTQIDLVTEQGNGFTHPQQVAVERSLHTGSKIAERIRMTPVPAAKPFGMAAVVSQPNHVYVGDQSNGSLYEMEADTGKVVRHFSPSTKLGNTIQGIATGLGEDIYINYNGIGKIQRLHKDGTVVETFDAPTKYGHSLVYKAGQLYLLDDGGDVYQIDAVSKKVVKKTVLKGPGGKSFSQNQTFSLMWDGSYFTLANAQDNWKLYRYNTDWSYHDTVDLQQWGMMGVVFDGKEYLTLNNDNNRIFTIRVTDDTSGEVGAQTSSDYQYQGNVLTTSDAKNAFPHYQDNNIELLFNDKAGSINTDLLKPLVSYVDNSGKRTGSMFDSFLFLPSITGAKAMFYKKTSPTEWSAYIQKSVQDMATLDKEWAAKNSELGQSDKAKVWLAVPYPDPADDLTTREQALHSYIDQAMAQVGAQHFANLNFRGFYWYNEDANYGESLVVDFNKYVHGKSASTLWIPYVTAQEVTDYSVLGFDEVYQQPNYYFQDQNPPNTNRFFNLTWTGARYHKGVEMELDYRALNDQAHRKLFTDYLHYGLVEGYLGASMAWYDEGTISLLARQHDPLYDVVHQVVTGTYAEDGVKVTTPQPGSLTSSQAVSISTNSKIRLDVVANQPYHVQRVVLHTDEVNKSSLSFTGTLRVDEELVVKDGKLVKQEIGHATTGLRIGFNDSMTSPVTVIVMPQGTTIFSDIPPNDPAAGAITTLNNQGIINGYTDANGQLVFAPKGSITRAQFAVMLTSAYHLKAAGSVPFWDAKNAWYSNAVAAVAQSGLMSGYEGNRFGPNDPITEEQVASILVRALHQAQVKGDTTGVTIHNQSQVHDWALQDVLEGKSLGLFSDTFGATDFSPRTAATRADVAMALSNALNAKAK